jgi:hypothetical protein
MTTKAERRIGLTPAFKRIAYYYVKLGYGKYTPKNHPHYDMVLVRELYDFKEGTDGKYAGGIVVEFYLNGQKVKWVEFRCQAVGGGGEDAIKRVK